MKATYRKEKTWDSVLSYAENAQRKNPTEERALLIEDLKKINQISEQKEQVAHLTFKS